MSWGWERTPLVPARVAAAVWDRRGRRSWETAPGVRADARRALALVTGHDAPGLDAAARDHAIHNHFKTGLALRVREQGGRWIDGHHLRDGLAQKRGVIASYPHLGPLAGIGVALSAYDPRACSTVGGWMFQTGQGHRIDLITTAWLEGMRRAGVTVFEAAGSGARIAAALREGRTVGMAYDVPGETPTRFLGHDVTLASGTARLAAETGALVVPIARGRRGPGAFTRAWPALEPGPDLHQALAEHHTRVIRERPWEYEDPVRPGWWGEQLANVRERAV